MGQGESESETAPPGWHSRDIEDLPWPVLIRVAICRGVVCMLITLLVVAFLPRPFGFIGTTIVTGSMTPGIQPGDVALVRPIEEYLPGQVILYFNPARPEEQVMHRIVEVNPDGTLVTKGDANATADSTPVHPDAVIGVGRVLIPVIGLPIVWAARGEVLLVIATVLLAALLIRGSLTVEFFPSTRKRRAVRGVIEGSLILGMLVLAIAIVVIGVARSTSAAFVERATTTGTWAMGAPTPTPTPTPTATATPSPSPSPSPSTPLPTGSLGFNNLSYYWAYGTGGSVVGLQANTSVIFAQGNGTIPKITLVITIDNTGGLYLVGGMPVIVAGSPNWAAAGPGTASGNDIVYTFTWTGSLPPYWSTQTLEATVPFTTPLPGPPTDARRWTAVASADGVTPATGSGGFSDVEDEGPPVPAP